MLPGFVGFFMFMLLAVRGLTNDVSIKTKKLRKKKKGITI